MGDVSTPFFSSKPWAGPGIAWPITYGIIMSWGLMIVITLLLTMLLGAGSGGTLTGGSAIAMLAGMFAVAVVLMASAPYFAMAKYNERLP
jgi:hypothetical protein